MSFTRSRVVRSSSQGEIGLFNHTLPVESPVSSLRGKALLPSLPQRRLKSTLSLQYRQRSSRLAGVYSRWDCLRGRVTMHGRRTRSLVLGLESFLKLVSCARRNSFRTRILTCMVT
ncbi:uncharacterized protein LOC110673263 isoform X2 [Hevea brasiliensis]|uniref:uncharacterized protein LOC110673263 isoform X2 n=1 Tax=Hevea brasiliensis TaxID=3981 RepID=UPI0025CE6261|nr:uncharacterized protein LOC110673263 isoform X2 [Hevea brasiliensis]